MPKGIKKDEFKKKEKKEGGGNWWETLWGTAWLELLILFFFLLGIAALLIPFIDAQFALTRAYLWIIIDHIVRPVFIIADTILMTALIYAFLEGLKWRPELSIFEKYHPESGSTLKEQKKDETIIAQWERIKEKAASGTEEALRLAFIEADALVDVYLRKYGLLGETMGERLNQVSSLDAPSLQRVWDAHRLRNDLVHSPGFQLAEKDALKGLESFEEFLKELGAI